MVTACHDRGIVHKDVKDENLVVDLDTNKILLIDFGSGGFLVEEDEFKYEGTRVYAPPEWIVSQRYRYEGLHIYVGPRPISNKNILFFLPETELLGLNL